MDLKKIFDLMLDDRLKSLNVLAISQVVSYDKTIGKVDVKPLYKVKINNELIEMPVIVNVPVLHIGNSDYIINIPIVVGDIIPVFFSDYDIQNLVLSGELKDPNTDDIHSLDDGIALPVVLNPFNTQLPQNNIDDLSIQKRNGLSKIVLKSDSETIIIEATTIKLGEGATKAVKLFDDTAATKVFAE